MLIDCDSCEVRDVACDDCVVSVLLGTPQVPRAEPSARPYVRSFDPEERAALQVLADHGLIPPLRLAGPEDGDAAAPACHAV